MRRIVIDMQSALFADAVAEALRNFDSDLEPILSESPDKTLSLCDTVLANVLIMEVTIYTKTQRKNWRTKYGRPRRTVWWIILFTALFLPAISLLSLMHFRKETDEVQAKHKRRPK